MKYNLQRVLSCVSGARCGVHSTVFVTMVRHCTENQPSFSVLIWIPRAFKTTILVLRHSMTKVSTFFL